MYKYVLPVKAAYLQRRHETKFVDSTATIQPDCNRKIITLSSLVLLSISPITWRRPFHKKRGSP
jgi:hypothetical protein